MAGGRWSGIPTDFLITGSGRMSFGMVIKKMMLVKEKIPTKHILNP